MPSTSSLPPGSAVAGYARVSTESQTVGESLPGQRSVIAAEVTRRGWDLVDFGQDSMSGRSIHRRPGLEGLLHRLDDGELAALMVARLDRLSRSVRDVYDLMDRASKRGWSLVCLDPDLDMTTPYGRAFAGMAAVFSQFERELIGQRQRESIAARKAAGIYKGPQPEVSDEAVRRMVYLESQGVSVRRIADLLTLEGYPAPRGDVWHFQTVSKALRRDMKRRLAEPDCMRWVRGRPDPPAA